MISSKKFKEDKISKNDIIEYINNESSFAFERKVMSMVIQKGFNVDYSGTYIDPITSKPREFDIRASMIYDYPRCGLSIECKNIKESYPVVISTLPRLPRESWHSVYYINTHEHGSPTISIQVHGNNKRQSFYTPGEPVGKQIVQIGKNTDGNFSSSSSELYSKWEQAFSSLHELGLNIFLKQKKSIGILIPIVVVPDNTLWTANFDMLGTRISDPTQVERCSFYMKRSIDIHEFQKYDVSHLEFFTFSGLYKFLDCMRNEARLKNFILFSQEPLVG